MTISIQAIAEQHESHIESAEQQIEHKKGQLRKIDKERQLLESQIENLHRTVLVHKDVIRRLADGGRSVLGQLREEFGA